ncbi:hypothetical protein [Roseibacillus persicicus]|uniref:hypothetical protein n=1 Tax=Roseibacillus persicicus TaxID=454148 RepID=UPI00280D0B9A|nr:hypothetical protein [Roseibacillus persicicus]MDQ8192668.1 hypothetical protein [Roseibacillus persicicus]
MQKEHINLEPRNLGERWFQFGINNASRWMPLVSLLLGLGFTALYFNDSTQRVGFFGVLGPLWLVLALLHYERYHARKTLERLLIFKESKAQKDVEQGAATESDRAGG